MPVILSVSSLPLSHEVSQNLAMDFAKEMFGDSFKDLNRLLKLFENGQVKRRFFTRNLEWFKEEHTFEEKNDIYIDQAVEFGVEAVRKCLTHSEFLTRTVNENEINAFIFVSSTGIATPTIDARIMNKLPFSRHTKRIPLWGLGCAGGASGLARAFEYCKAFPNSNVIVLTIELCSLTFQKNDVSKSNLVGTSLFGDGVACALVCGDESNLKGIKAKKYMPKILGTHSTLMSDSLDIMGWKVKNEGLYVIFSKDIPSIMKGWLLPNVKHFLKQFDLEKKDLSRFIAHPGGKKVLDAYQYELGVTEEMLSYSKAVLHDFGNMSSATILYVLERVMQDEVGIGEYGLAAALGPGFSSEMLLLKWEA
ncbi:type III polyketide synthase [Peribacillus tepidiphilus]|uniref:type III polyketide synthase n=1 Tax=Peribacillus tepidiphilus TaxID=2652445 RepID=UPI0035B52122